MYKTSIRWLCAAAGASTTGASSSTLLQSHERMNRQYFALFGLPVDVDVPSTELQLRYRSAQKVIHPDKKRGAAAAAAAAATTGASTSATQTASSSSKETEDGTPATFDSPWLNQMKQLDSSTPNVAYETLRSPFLRCKYLSKLLRLSSVEIRQVPSINDAVLEEQRRKFGNTDVIGAGGKDSSSSSPSGRLEDSQGPAVKGPGGSSCYAMSEEESNVSLPVEFLMEVMELNEEVADLAAESAEAHAKVTSASGEVEGLAEHSPQWKAKFAGLTVDVQQRCEVAQAATFEAWKAQDDAMFHDCVHRWTYCFNLAKQLKALE